MTSNKPVRIIGVPMDLGASRRGTDMGPSALRIAGLGRALRGLGYQVETEQDIPVPAMETRSAASADARFKEEILTVCSDLCDRVRETLDQNDIPLVIGGDHSIAMGTVSGVAGHFRQKEQKIGLIWFDAHGDMNIPGVSPSGNIHGMPLAHLLGRGDEDLASIGGFKGKIDPKNVALVGIRDIDDGERKIIRESGIHAYTMREIDERGMAAVSREIIEVVNDGTAGFHISFDVDGCDPSVIPGSGTLVPGGINFREAHLMLEHCADSGRMVSMEVVELNPFLDHGNVSAERTLQLIMSAFGKSIL
ncbi:MAG: arginase [Lysobacteraceae bacterium]|nr:MAG: arginase [Xanthomonadaceae bacterium]